jgi:hypothetical protein
MGQSHTPRIHKGLSNPASPFQPASFTFYVQEFYFHARIMSNSTGKILELSCDDSPLSVTGSIIGILTLAYAILATIVFLTTSLAGASQEKRQFAARLEGEIKSLELLIELLRNSSHLVPNDNGVARRLDRRLDQATKIIQDVMRQVFGDVFEWESPHRRHFRSRARFLSEKENLSQHFDHIVSHRTQLEAVFQGLMARYSLTVSLI